MASRIVVHLVDIEASKHPLCVNAPLILCHTRFVASDSIHIAFRQRLWCILNSRINGHWTQAEHTLSNASFRFGKYANNSAICWRFQTPSVIVFCSVNLSLFGHYNWFIAKFRHTFCWQKALNIIVFSRIEATIVNANEF